MNRTVFSVEVETIEFEVRANVLCDFIHSLFITLYIEVTGSAISLANSISFAVELHRSMLIYIWAHVSWAVSQQKAKKLVVGKAVGDSEFPKLAKWF